MCGRYSIIIVPGAMRRLFRFSNALPIAASSLVARTPQTPSDEAYWNGRRAGIKDTGGTIASYAAHDGPRYAADPSYRQAWDNGYAICFNQKFLGDGH